MAYSPRTRRIALFAAGVVAASLAFAGYRTYQTTFARDGESALSLIPADSLGVVTVDLTPSPGQLMAFKAIDDALSREKKELLMQTSLLEMVENTKFAERVAPFAKRSGAFALVDSKDEQGYMILNLTDGARVQSILREEGLARFWRGTQSWKVKGGRSFYMVRGDRLIIGPSERSLHTVDQVIAGKVPPITTSESFRAARAKVASDANVIAIMNGNLWNEFSGETQKEKSPFTGYQAFGLAIRDGGMEVSGLTNSSLDAFKGLKAMAEAKPLTGNDLARLPQGGYTFFGVSQPGKWTELITDTIREQNAETGENTEFEFAEEYLGVNLEKDLPQALAGNFFVAAVPKEIRDGKPYGIGFVAVMTADHGASAGTITRQALDHMEAEVKKSSEGNNEKLWIRETKAGVTYYTVEEEDDGDVSLPENITGEIMVKPDAVEDMDVVIGIEGETVVIGTSQAIVDRALTAQRAPNTDQEFASLNDGWLGGAQYVMALSPTRMIEGLLASTDSMDKKKKKEMEEQMTPFLRLNEPVRMRAAMETSGQSTMSIFIPMDYAALMDLVFPTAPKAAK